MTFSDDVVEAYVSGHLDAQRQAALEGQMRTDAALAERVRAQRTARELARAGSEPDESGWFSALVAQSTPEPHLLPPQPAAGPSPGVSWLPPRVVSLLACTMIGVALGVALRSPVGWLETVDGHLIARGALALSLSERLAAESATADAFAVGASFASRDGSLCRTFTTAGVEHLVGMACRTDAGWRIEALLSAAAVSDPGAQATRGTVPSELARIVDERINGSILDMEAERVARESDWRR